MKKELTAIIIATLISSVCIPTIATIKGIERLEDEIMHLPYNYASLGSFSNLCVIAIASGLLLLFVIELWQTVKNMRILENKNSVCYIKDNVSENSEEEWLKKYERYQFVHNRKK